MEKANIDLRQVFEENNIPQWKVADLLGISEFGFSRKLRKELPSEEKEKIIKIITDMKKSN